MIGLWARGLLAGRSGRLLGAIAGVALTVALIVAIGTDVTVTGTTAAPAGAFLHQPAALPEVKAAQLMMHRCADVGSDPQNMYGINVPTIGQATPMPHAYFAGASAHTALARLAVHRIGVLLSEETVRDFQLRLGDRLNLRLQNAADHQYRIVPFRYVGIVREFPTAAKDSFLVANPT